MDLWSDGWTCDRMKGHTYSQMDDLWSDRWLRSNEFSNGQTAGEVGQLDDLRSAARMDDLQSMDLRSCGWTWSWMDRCTFGW